MICAGGFALATTPRAGTGYVVVLGLGSAAALLRADFALAGTLGALLLIYCLIVTGSIWSTARLFGSRLMAEVEAARQNEVIGLLLRDFEENASDVLWETDAEGRLRHVSPRLAALFGLPVARLTDAPVFEVLQRIVPADDVGAAQLRALRQHLDSGTPFRDLPLASLRGSRQRWWSLTAKPLVDAQGHRSGWRGVASDVTEARQATEQLTWLAHFDPLTGLANRHRFRHELAQLLDQDTLAVQPFAVLCLDLDHFKTVNDTLGHAVGDALLQVVGQRLLAHARPNDTVARLGGDEFALLLRDVTDAEEAEELTLRLLDGLQGPCEVQGAQVAVRSSIGVALAPRDGADIDTLLNHADLALYAAKSAGRGTLRFFAPQMAASTRRRLALEQALRLALQRGELSLQFQPQADFQQWKITGFEALARWDHPELGAVAPAEFVPVAEETGLIGEIGNWVLAEACRQAATWPGELQVSVNVSPAQAMSKDLARTALATALAAGLAPSRLELEITESVFLQDTQATAKMLADVRAAGLRIALDDFGTGYSSLAYLRRFPFDTLKIDSSFVRELMTRGDARAIVRMIVGLAQTLRMRTVAEGVEEPAHATVLQRYGCDALQGYLVGQPLDARHVPDFLAAWPLQARPALQDVPPTTPMPLRAGL
jgi:diguanylate cyclase (GGDEF)-like protein/PAS domain S-box-containing protein